MVGHTSPLDISSFIDVKENEDQEALMTCPPKTGPDVMLESGRKIIRRRQVDGTKKVLTGTNHPTTQRS